MLRGKPVNQFNEIKTPRNSLEIGFQGHEAVKGLTLSDNIQIPAVGQQQAAIGQQLYISAQLALGAAHPLGHCLNLAQRGRVKGEKPIRLTQIHFPDNNSFGLINPG